MKTKALDYSVLTVKERFKLILAADSRGDDTDRQRLACAGRSLSLTAPDHLPMTQAFHEVNLLVFIELVEDAAYFTELRIYAVDRAMDPDNEDGELPSLRRSRALAKASAYLLKVKVEGWKRFCEKLGTPAFAAWELAQMPGLERLKRALESADEVAFTPGEMTHWLNGTKGRAGNPPLTEADMKTPDRFAADLKRMFAELVAYYGG